MLAPPAFALTLSRMVDGPATGRTRSDRCPAVCGVRTKGVGESDPKKSSGVSRRRCLEAPSLTKGGYGCTQSRKVTPPPPLLPAPPAMRLAPRLGQVRPNRPALLPLAVDARSAQCRFPPLCQLSSCLPAMRVSDKVLLIASAPCNILLSQTARTTKPLAEPGATQSITATCMRWNAISGRSDAVGIPLILVQRHL